MRHSLQRTARTLARLARRLRLNQGGVAAVEFALILPLMLLIYLGSAEVTQALMASRKATLVAGTLADLISQQQNGVNVTDADLTNAFAAGAAIMAPFSAGPAYSSSSASNPGVILKMTITSIWFKPDSSAKDGYDAIPEWTTTSNGPPRPCGPTALTDDPNNADAPAPGSLPTGVYAQGALIVADVSYSYMPTFGSSFFAAGSPLAGALTYNHTSYMRPRQWNSAPGYIAYTPGSMATVCPP